MVDDTFPCPHCGEDVPAKARFCRACGASDDSGWNEDGWYDAPTETDDDFDYDDYVAREFPDHAPPQRLSTRQLLVGLIILVLCVSILLWSIG